MDSNQVENCLEVDSPVAGDQIGTATVSLESEIPEFLYQEMKAFVSSNPNWNQYEVMSSALANFLFQNGSEERAVKERYLDDIFNLPDAISH